MAGSSLSFVNSSTFRDTLISKNLVPYTIQGVYTPPSGPVTYETNLNVSEVIDSPNELITNGGFANQLYPLNEYGPEGGFNTQITYNGPPLPTEPNKGEYDPNDTILDIVNEFYIDSAFIENIYGPEGGFNQMVVIDSIQNNNKLYLPYWEPPTFTPSSYTPYQILLSDNPTGTNGPLSQDSFIAKLGAQTLRDLFRERINTEILQNTVGLVNLESLSDPFEASLIATGKEPLIYQNWRITVPEFPLLAAADFITRLGGAYFPVSPIPGDYFNENIIGGQPSQQTSTALNVVNQLTGGFLGPILNITRNPSQIFLANTGNAQRSALFRNLNFNRYQPSYEKNFGGLLGVAQGLVNLAVSLINPDNGTLIGGYYVGSKNAEPSTITSPPNQIPVTPFGKQDPTPVYGPSELGILYEGNEEKLNFGLKGKSLTDGGGVDGQFVWTSPKYKRNAGFKPTIGGGTSEIDEDFNIISSSYESNESTNITFKQSSILDQTQRLIDSADNVSGIARLKHVGNAINQVSKVFNDGYKEMTKGSKVISYIDNTTGGETGVEYCRVFAKDTPYYTYNDLQKKDGITTSGRRFTNSVLDNTFNLNISPTRNPGSTNIIPDVGGIGGYAKKYMFSIENLAWRTSSRPGYTYDELPTCEKGPNGGRVMWFPPYGLTFSDNSTANWTPTSFLGRPEPIYTYKDTSRTGSLTWKIIVDHPSVMNTIIEKQLKGQSKERINSIIDSFFAGCVKYDIYELAQKFNSIPTRDLYTYQEILTNPRLTNDEYDRIKNEISADNNGGTQTSKNEIQNNEDPSAAELETSFTEFAFYFDNNIPGPSQGVISNSDYLETYNNYISSSNIETYKNIANSTFKNDDREKNVEQFFNIIKSNYEKFEKEFIPKAYEILKNGGKIKMVMEGSASASSSPTYNKSLSERRIDSVKKFFSNYQFGGNSLKEFIENKKFIIESSGGRGEEIVIPTSDSGSGFEVDCTKDIPDKNNNTNNTNAQKYSVSAMACRRVKVKTLKITTEPKIKGDVDEPKVVETNNIIPKPAPTVDVLQKVKEGISKKILRNLLSECDYFEVVKETNPMVLDTIKEKIKYFNPLFHSITPEGLNARLTFLNQCVRPGETIPTIGTDGKPKFNDAVNTSFGAPPVLILRIGDFYNTKIIPRNISFTYDPLIFDMNPEGIGLQPMIANVTLTFDFIGGHGLAKPVEQLQNALSFNFYANTEIYDERSVWTEDTSALDQKIVETLSNQEFATINNIDNVISNDGGSTIGEILNTVPTSDGQSGETSYRKIMDSLVDNTEGYFQSIVNKLESINLSYNYGIVQLLNKERNFKQGNIINNSTQIEIYGKPHGWELTIDGEISKLLADIDNDTNPITSYLKKFYKKTNDFPIRDVKSNMKKYILSLSDNFKNGITTILQEVVIEQQNYVQNIRKLNVISEKIDGKILDTNLPRVYGIVETNQNNNLPNTYDELITDYTKLKPATEQFNELLSNSKYQVAFGNSTFTDNGDYRVLNTKNLNTIEEKRSFLIMSRIFSDKNKKIDFINFVIKGDLTKDKKLKNKFENIVEDLSKIYEKELKDEVLIFEKLKNDNEFKNLTQGIDNVLYNKGKVRKFEYSTLQQPTTNQIESISNLYKTINVNQNKATFNGKIKFD